MKSGAKVFFIIGKGPHTAYAGAILKNIDLIYRLIRETTEPFVAKIYQSRDEVELWVTHTQWLEGRRLSERKR
jgi:hypothetical protein